MGVEVTYRTGGVLGNARAFRRDPLSLLVAAHADGRGVARIPLVGSRSLYSLADTEAVRQALIDNRENYVKGKSWAWLRRAVAIALLARRFRLELLPDQPVEYLTSVTLRPREGTQMRVAAR